MNWTEAQRYCREHHTDLVSVRNQTENQNLLVLLKSLNHYSITTWIGLYRTRSWSDGSNSTFSYWKPGQPDNGGQNEYCIAVSFEDYGQWTTENCIQTLPFLCYSAIPSTSFRQYHFVNESKTWTEAQTYCRELYTDLATIDNMEEMDMLINTVNANYSGLAWIGQYDDLEGWRWSLDDDSFYMEGERDYRGWYQEPDNYGGKELCVYMSSSGTWVDTFCESNNYFVCYDGTTRSHLLINQRMYWPHAQRYCREHHTDLASVRNWTENQRILNMSGGLEVWIGLYRTRTWSDQHNFTYENWRPEVFELPNQPDNGLNVMGLYSNQHCTAVSFADSGLWRDEDCLATLPFVCYNRLCTGSSCVPHQYHFINEPMTWAAAQSYCRENYTDLATFDNVQEVNGLLMTVKDTYSGLAWIGLYDDLNSWRWSLEYDSFYKENERNFRNWYIMEPSNTGGDKLCVYFSDIEGAWYEYNCDSGLRFICYDGREGASQRFVVPSEYMVWTEAQSYCREHYTDLASVRSEAENQMLKSFVKYYRLHLWIGLYRTRSWSDGSNSSFSNWRPGQPDNYGQNEHCTAVSFYDDYIGQWTDENCDQAFPFLCYSDLPSRQYHFVNESKTWTEAQSYCRELYTDLATIDNMEEMNMIINTVNGNYSGLAWIGLYDDLDSWRWSLDNDSFYMEGERDYRGWYREPDNYGGDELCVHMSGSGRWFDITCFRELGFVCYNGKNCLRLFGFLQMATNDFHGENNTYVYFSEKMTWSEAQSFCRTYYTDLASVRNETELQQILRVSNGDEVWIGLYRNHLWSDQSNSTFRYWTPRMLSFHSEPDNGMYSPWNLRDQHCTAVDLTRSAQWTDENCLARFPFFCYGAAALPQQAPGLVVGLRMKVRAAGHLAQFQIEGMLLEQVSSVFYLTSPQCLDQADVTEEECFHSTLHCEATL
ncbi:hypothetical protein NFI96_015580, partial [Prochilodus magdalenae]